MKVFPLRRTGGEAGLATATRAFPPVQASRLESASQVELRLCARPETALAGFEEQVRSMYVRLLAALAGAGFGPGDLVAEKIFLATIAGNAARLCDVRRDMLLSAGGDHPVAPALSIVEQPPANPGAACELQAFALRGPRGTPLGSGPIENLPAGVRGRMIRLRDRRIFFLSGVTSGRRDADRFELQARDMFARAERGLEQAGLGFRDVARTWIHVADIDRDYAALNAVRRDFYRSRGVVRLPASTGIGGLPDPPGRRCGLDLVAAAGGGERLLRPLSAVTMNEASSYGADFSRAMRLDLGDGALLFISGTASIDAQGRVLHPGSIAAQAERMLDNLEQLLLAQRAGLEHLTSAVTYLKRPEFLEICRSAAVRRGLPHGLPHTYCVAEVCRPDWLCEIEATAFVP